MSYYYSHISALALDVFFSDESFRAVRRDKLLSSENEH